MNNPCTNDGSSPPVEKVGRSTTTITTPATTTTVPTSLDINSNNNTEYITLNAKKRKWDHLDRCKRKPTPGLIQISPDVANNPSTMPNSSSGHSLKKEATLAGKKQTIFYIDKNRTNLVDCHVLLPLVDLISMIDTSLICSKCRIKMSTEFKLERLGIAQALHWTCLNCKKKCCKSTCLTFWKGKTRQSD